MFDPAWTRRARLAAIGVVLFFSPALLASAPDDDGDGFEVSPAGTLLSSNGIAFNSEGTRAYVSSSYGGVSVIDPIAARNVGTFDISRSVSSPSGIGCARGKLYVTSMRDVAVVDEATGIVLRTLARPFVAGSIEGDVAATPDGSRVVVAMGTSPLLAVIDTADDSVAGSVPLGANYNRVALSPDGAVAYVTNKEAGAIATVDLAAFGVVRVQSIAPDSDILDFPCAVAVRPGNGDVIVSYVTPDYAGHLAVFSAEGERRRVIHVGRFATGVDVSGDGRFAMVGSGDVFDLESGARVASLDVPQNAISDVVFAPGRDERALVTDAGDRHVQVATGFDPSLVLSAGTARAGEALTFALDMPGEGGRPFQLAASESTRRGIPLAGGLRFPLDADRLFRATRAAAGPFASAIGTLDRNGRATVAVTLAPADLPFRGAGYPVSFAYATFGSGRLRADARRVSNAVTVVLLP